MVHREVELLAIGAGPSNLSLAVALEELAPDGLATNSLLIEQGPTVEWQRGMLLPGTQSQVSFLKDLVSLRNPRSAFSFVNYLHSVGRLDQFANLGTFTPYRTEISDYLRWVAEHLTKVSVQYNRRATAIEPLVDENGDLTGWLTRLADGDTIGSRYLVVGAGRDKRVPDVFKGLPERKVIHSTEYVDRIAELPRELPYRVTVVGGAQSAAEMFLSVQTDLPNSRPTMVMRSIGMNAYESSKFINELYYPSFVGEFYDARPEQRAQILQEMHKTNYSGLAPGFLDALYRRLYLDAMSPDPRLRVVTMVDVTDAREVNDEVVLSLTDRKTGLTEELRTDLVLLGTGFDPGMPRLVGELAARLGLPEVSVSRRYRLETGDSAGAVYLQGVNEATHGISDSLLSVLAWRAQEIVADLLDHRAARVPTPAVAAAAPAVAVTA